MTQTPFRAGSSGFDEVNGFRVTEAGPDRTVVEWDVSSQHLQPNGIVHGGVYCSVIETAASVGAAFWLGERGSVVGVSNQTDFLRAINSGHLTAVATPIHRGRSQQLWQVEITDERERRVARGQVRLQNLQTS